jgi:hypothetical protein
MDQSLARAKFPKGTEGSLDLDADYEQLSLLEEASSLQFGKLESAFRTKSFENQELLCQCTDTFHDSLLILEGVVSVIRKRGDDLYVERIERQGAVFLLGPLDGLGSADPKIPDNPHIRCHRHPTHGCQVRT